jgi:hypothetical protein
VFKQVHKLLLFLALLWASAPPSTQAQVIDCPNGFSSSGTCGVLSANSFGQESTKPFEIWGTVNGSSRGLSGSQVELISPEADHAALSLHNNTRVNVQAFTSTFTFVPNESNITFILNNSNNNLSFNGQIFSAGAGCESDFF